MSWLCIFFSKHDEVAVSMQPMYMSANIPNILKTVIAYLLTGLNYVRVQRNFRYLYISYRTHVWQSEWQGLSFQLLNHFGLIYVYEFQNDLIFFIYSFQTAWRS